MYIDPFRDPLGTAYNVIQAKIAIGSGQLLGKGVSGATQSRLAFLPERHTDFIFAVFAEMWGFAGCLVLIMAYGLLVLRGFEIAANAREPRGRIVALGVTALFATQTLDQPGDGDGALARGRHPAPVHELWGIVHGGLPHGAGAPPLGSNAAVPVTRANGPAPRAGLVGGCRGQADRRERRRDGDPSRRAGRQPAHRAVRRAGAPALHRRQHLQGRRHQRPPRHAGGLRRHRPAQGRLPLRRRLHRQPHRRGGDEDGGPRARRTARGDAREEDVGEAEAKTRPAFTPMRPSRRCCARARRSSSRSPRSRSAPRAPASPPSSPSPGATSSTCRSRGTWACPGASTTRPSASGSAASSRRCGRRRAASS